MKTLGIIGTAGCGDDGKKLEQAGYWILMRAVAQAVVVSHKPDMLISGGAAYSDHLAVQLFLEGYAPALRLHLACEFTPFGFKETSSKFDTGRTSNYYHGIFSQHHLLNSYFEIQAAIEKGATTTLGTGFKERNPIPIVQSSSRANSRKITVNKEKQRIAIAEACGWTKIVAGPGFADSTRKYPIGVHTIASIHTTLPDYLTDLNAMHEAEKVLTPGHREIYKHFLFDKSVQAGDFDSWCAIHATAAQRAEAFLKTIGKWEDDK